MDCPNCKQKPPDGSNFCPNCGQSLVVVPEYTRKVRLSIRDFTRFRPRIYVGLYVAVIMLFTGIYHESRDDFYLGDGREDYISGCPMAH